MILDQHGRPRGDHPPCKHEPHQPTFDAKAAEGLDEYEVRRRWPRFVGRCSQCGQQVILYASAEHFVAGDW